MTRAKSGDQIGKMMSEEDLQVLEIVRGRPVQRRGVRQEGVVRKHGVILKE